MIDNSFNLLNHIVDEQDQSIVIWLFNIGVERYWSNFTNVVKDPNEDKIVRHIEEINLLITRKQDYMIMRRPPSDEFLSDLDSLGFCVPHIICPSCENDDKDISELILEDDSILDLLKELGRKDCVYFVPYGVSHLEEKISDVCGLHLIGNSNEHSKIVNNKIFSKNTARELGLPFAEDKVCTSVEEIEEAYYSLSKKYSKVIIKMPCNSSGRGMWVLDSERKFKTVCAIIKRIAKTHQIDEWLVEGWIDKKMDLNYQIYVSETGYVSTFSIKEQIVEETLYVGSVLPARIDDVLTEECKKCGSLIGKYLYSLGYTGVFGIDALIADDGTLIPIIEINGRFTLSTYLSFIEKRYGGKFIYAYYKRFCSSEVDYKSLKEKMQDRNLWVKDGNGIFIYNESTADSSLANGRLRLFCLAIGDSEDHVNKLKNDTDKLCDSFILFKEN